MGGGAQGFIRGVDAEIDLYWVSGQNFLFNLSKHITLNFIRYNVPHLVVFSTLDDPKAKRFVKVLTIVQSSPLASVIDTT